MIRYIKILLITLGLYCYPISLWAEVILKTTANTPIYAQILDEYRKVGEFYANFNLLSAKQDSVLENNVPIHFGNGIGFIAQHSVQQDDLPNKNIFKKIENINGYIITTKNTAIYNSMDENSLRIATLAAQLRYPFIAKLADSQNKYWYQILLADRMMYIKESDVQQDNGIPIIMYHHVLQDQENQKYRNTPTTVSTDALRFQFNSMQDLGFKVVQLDILEEYLQGKINLPAKVVSLTFDDGLKSVYRYAYPLLKEYNFTATLFVITSRIQSEPQNWEPNSLQFLSVSEYLAMTDRIDLQSHSHSLHHHKNFKPAATQHDYQTLYIDLIRSKQELMKLNHQTQYLAYPFGAYNDDYIAATQNTGFTLALTTKWGKVKFADDPLLLKRVYFMSDTTKEKIQAILEN